MRKILSSGKGVFPELSYLNKKLGILVNFRRKYITPKRVLNFSTKE
ncbi:MAG: hypothetical protein QMC93_02775 [Patescibacteria group bacterium]|nr:hypothetical protein [Patescibacteria group bacterium]